MKQFKKRLLTSYFIIALIFSAGLELAAKIIFEPTSFFEPENLNICQQVSKQAPLNFVSKTPRIFSESALASSPKPNFWDTSKEVKVDNGQRSYDVLENNELVKKLIQCCLTGDSHGIDSLFNKVSKKLANDCLFPCALGEVNLLHVLKDNGMVNSKCTNTFDKQLKMLDEAVEKKIASAAPTSALAAYKPQISQASTAKFACLKDSQDVKIFLKNVRNELHSCGCSEKHGQLTFEPGTYIDGLSDLSIILASPAFFVDAQIRAEAVKTIQQAFEIGQRHFEASPYFPVVNAYNKASLIKYYQELLLLLINDYLQHESFAQDAEVNNILIALKNKITAKVAIPSNLPAALPAKESVEKKNKAVSPSKISSNIFAASKNKAGAVSSTPTSKPIKPKAVTIGRLAKKAANINTIIERTGANASNATNVILSQEAPIERKTIAKKDKRSAVSAAKPKAQEPAVALQAKRKEQEIRNHANQNFPDLVESVQQTLNQRNKKTVKKSRRA